jgi:hypothetical protein
MENEKWYKDYLWVKKVIESSNSKKHSKTCTYLCDLWFLLHVNQVNNPTFAKCYVELSNLAYGKHINTGSF